MKSPHLLVIFVLFLSACSKDTEKVPGTGESTPQAWEEPEINKQFASFAPDGESVPQRGGILVMSIDGKPLHFNPALQSGVTVGLPASQIFARLLLIDREWQYHPYLAQSWEQDPAGAFVVFHLRKNAFFHDGTPITADDVAFSIETVKKYHPFNSMLSTVEKVETPDNYTVKVLFSRPHPAFLTVAASPMLPILPRHIYGQGDILTNPANVKPIGSGPFRFVEISPDNKIILDRFDRFFIEGRPYLDRIVMEITTGDTVQVGIESGTIQLTGFYSSTTEYIAPILAKPELEMELGGYEGIGPIFWLAFNTTKAPFDNKKVRKAVAYAIDREKISRVLTGDFSRVMTGPIHYASPFYTPEVELYLQDIEKANRLLDEAGYPRNEKGIRFETELEVFPTNFSTELSEYFRAELLKNAGILLKLNYHKNLVTWGQKVALHDFTATIDNVFNWGDPVIGVHRTYLTSNIRKGVLWSNTQLYSNPRVDALLDQAGTEMDQAKRKALYAEFQQVVVEDVPVLWITSYPIFTIKDKKLKGYPRSIWGTMVPMDTLYWAKE